MDTYKITIMMDVIDNALHDSSKPWYSLFGWAEAKTGMGRFKLLLSAVTLVSFYLVLGYGTVLFSNVIGFAYPAYATQSFILTPRPPMSDRETAAHASTQRKLFTYWMTFAAFLNVENHCPFVMQLIPFYRLLRTLFLVWCFVPIEENGASVVYENVIHRYFNSRISYDH